MNGRLVGNSNAITRASDFTVYGDWSARRDQMGAAEILKRVANFETSLQGRTQDPRIDSRRGARLHRLRESEEPTDKGVPIAVAAQQCGHCEEDLCHPGNHIDGIGTLG